MQNNDKEPSLIAEEIIRLMKRRRLTRKALWQEVIMRSKGRYDFSYPTMCRKLENDDRLSGKLLKMISQILDVKPGVLFGEPEEDNE